MPDYPDWHPPGYTDEKEPNPLADYPDWEPPGKVKAASGEKVNKLELPCGTLECEGESLYWKNLKGERILLTNKAGETGLLGPERKTEGKSLLGAVQVYGGCNIGSARWNLAEVIDQNGVKHTYNPAEIQNPNMLAFDYIKEAAGIIVVKYRVRLETESHVFMNGWFRLEILHNGVQIAKKEITLVEQRGVVAVEIVAAALCNPGDSLTIATAQEKGWAEGGPAQRPSGMGETPQPIASVVTPSR